MDSHLPSDVLSALAGPKKSAGGPKRRLRLRTGTDEIEVVEMWHSGFAVALDAPRVKRGFVDLYDGGRHLYHGLAYPTAETTELRLFAFKTRQDADAAPPPDYERSVDAPAGLLPRF
ncbi:hypothetical protein ACW9UR_01360 [Halovulum sp. GXIMD14794]